MLPDIANKISPNSWMKNDDCFSLSSELPEMATAKSLLPLQKSILKSYKCVQDFHRFCDVYTLLNMCD